MENLLFLIRIVFKKWKWLLAIPFVAAVAVYCLLSHQPKQYNSQTTIYTGIVSGLNASTESEKQDWMSVNNALDNLMSIILSESTLENVYLRLLARNMVHADLNQDNEYLTAKSSRELMTNLPDDVLQLLEKDDEDKTMENLRDYYSSTRVNYLRQLFLWEDPMYSYKALSTTSVTRIGSSDMIRISYTNLDPYIVCNTLKILIDEFIRQYMLLRFEQNDEVVNYFEDELDRIQDELMKKENALSSYNIKNQIINYEEQTKMVAERSRNIESSIEEMTRKLESARHQKELLEEKMGAAADLYKSNAEFISKMNELSSLYATSASSEDTATVISTEVQIAQKTENLKNISRDMISSKYSKEGMSLNDMTSQWLQAVMDEARAEAELKVLNNGYKQNVDAIKRFSPVGTSLARQNRDIEFSESNYREVLHGLNEAKLRRKNLQLSSATFRVLTPPTAAFQPVKTKTRLYTAIAFVLVLILLTTIEVINELSNRKPYDRYAAEKLTKTPVLGAYPVFDEDDEYGELCCEQAANHLGNAIVNLLDRTAANNVVNIISIDSGEGKSTVSTALMNFFAKLGTNPELVTWHKDFDYESKYYVMAGSIYDFAMNENNMERLPEANVILVEYPPVSMSSMPLKPLTTAAVNLVVVNAKRDWTGMDQLQLRKIKENVKTSDNLYICLNQADSDSVGAFTGMLPPYTKRHKIRFFFWNIGRYDA